MAKFKQGKQEPETFYTGLFWPCAANPVKHARRPTAVPIQKKKKFFIRCGCGTVVFFSKDWKARVGMTERQAVAAGLDIPEIILLGD